MSKNSRLKRSREYVGLSQDQLAEKIGSTRGYIAQIEKDKPFSYKKTVQLAQALGIDPDWLESGIGVQFVTEAKAKGAIENIPEDEERFIDLEDGRFSMRVPLVYHKAYAGYLAGFADQEFVSELPRISIDVVKYHKGNYQAFEVVGDSMTSYEPQLVRESIFDGSLVVGREIDKQHWRYKFHLHRYADFVIVHKRDGILVKRLTKHDVEQGIISCTSLNPDKDRYPDFDIHLDEVYQIFNIIKVIQDR